MNKSIYTVFIAIIIFSILGCSNIRVTVRTADREMVLEEYLKIKVSSRYLNYSKELDRIYALPIFDKVKMHKIITNDINFGISSNEIDIADKDDLIKNTLESIVKITSEIRGVYSEAIRLVKNDSCLEANIKINVANEMGIILQKTIEDELPTAHVTIATINMFSELNSDIVKNVDNDSKNGRDNLLGDPMVPFITKNRKKDTLWKSNYNTTKSRTTFGNSDIAIVLQEDPNTYNNNYAIKGVRVDADKLIQASFDGLAQAVNVVASTMGISMPQSANDDPYFNPTINPIIQNLPTEKNKLDAKQKEFAAYKKMIILEIFNKNLDANMSDQELKLAIEDIKRIWNSYKEKMNVELNK